MAPDGPSSPRRAFNRPEAPRVTARRRNCQGSWSDRADDATPLSLDEERAAEFLGAQSPSAMRWRSDQGSIARAPVPPSRQSQGPSISPPSRSGDPSPNLHRLDQLFLTFAPHFHDDVRDARCSRAAPCPNTPRSSHTVHPSGFSTFIPVQSHHEDRNLSRTPNASKYHPFDETNRDESREALSLEPLGTSLPARIERTQQRTSRAPVAAPLARFGAAPTSSSDELPLEDAPGTLPRPRTRGPDPQPPTTLLPFDETKRHESSQPP